MPDCPVAQLLVEGYAARVGVGNTGIDIDDILLLQLIRKILERDGHRVTAVNDPLEVRKLSLSDYSLILLDVMMPVIDGFSLCREIRDLADCPIVFLTAKSGEADVLLGLGLGGDDYLKKPFGAEEIRARVNAHLRREQREKKNAVEVSGFRFYLGAKQMEKDGQVLPLTKGEYAICEYLALHHGQTLSKEQIYEGVFGYDAEGDSSVIAMHVKNIRQKAEDFGKIPIQTVWGIGYTWKEKEV